MMMGIQMGPGFVYIIMKTQGFKGRVEGFSVKTVDTTGAGDSFVGALLFHIAKDPSIIQVGFFVNLSFPFFPIK